MIVSDTAVKNRISVLVLAVMILVFGTYCYRELPRENEPDITIPYVFISTVYKGVSASDIETSITIPIEKKIKGLEGVKEVTSQSAEGLSQISIEFVTDTDIDQALQDVKDKVDEAKQELPTDLEDDPSVFEVNFSELPILVLSLSGTCGPGRLKEIADDLEEDIESVPGVLEAEVTGGREREIRIEVDADKLAYYRIPITAFQAVVYSENRNTSGGAIRLGDGRFQVRVPGEFETPEEIYGLVVGMHDGQPIYLKDVARVVDGFKEETSRARLNSRDAVNISVKKRSGENIIEITDRIDRVIEEMKPAWPPGTQITKLMDHAKQTRLMVADLENNILSGLVLVIVVLLFALGLRNAILVGLAIPFSMLLSFTILYSLGFTLNNMVLFSLTLALGMLVDNAIVIVENIYRYIQQGVPRVQAAMKATSEVAYPVIGSTLTTLAAFFPLLFWSGIMGEFMSYLPATLIVTLFSSLVVALVINPGLAAFFMKTRGPAVIPAGLRVEEIARNGEQPIVIQGRCLRGYTWFLERALRHRAVVLLSSLALVVILFQIWLLRVGLEKPVEFFPNLDPRSVYVNINPPEGADLEYLDRIVRKVEMAVNGIPVNGKENPPDTSRVRLPLELYQASYVPKLHRKMNGEPYYGPSDLDNIEYVYAKVVEKSTGFSFGDNLPNHLGVQFIDFKDRRVGTSETMETLRRRMAAIPGAKITVDAQQDGPPTGAPINIEIAGDRFAVLGAIAGQVREIISRIPHVEDVRDDYIEGLPSLQIRVDRQKAALYGLTTGSIGFALKTAYNGLDVSTYREGDKDYDITVKLDERELYTTDMLHRLMIATPSGQLVPLTTVASIDYSGSVGDIIRINYERVVTVKANVDETRIPGAVARMQAEALLADMVLPPEYRITFTGENEFQQEAQSFLSKAFVTALFLIFLILVTLFNSISQPLIILSSVILSFGGVFLGLTVIQAPFGVIMSGVGVISLAGVVVNNAIVLIDYTNKLRLRGFDIQKAVIAAGATRFRPVLLTAVTTILGLAPMVTGVSWDFHVMELATRSESTQWWRSMASIVIFGLMTATFLTLVVVPVLYSSLYSMQARLGRWGAALRRLYWKPMEKYLPDIMMDR